MNFEVGALRSEDIIAMKKLNLIHHIASLEENSLAKEIFSVQNEMNWPGLVTECKELIENLNLPNITQQDVRDQWSKQRWKAITKKTIKAKCESELKDEMKDYSKLRDGPMMHEKFEMQDYVKQMKIEDARVNFSLKSKMYKAKFNYKNDPKYSADLWRCSSCMSGHIETQSHILYCDAYADLRADKDNNNTTT